MQQAGCGHHHLGVTLAERVIGDHARYHPAAEQQPGQPQRDVEHDLDMDPAVVRHAQPPGGVYGRGVPPGLELLIGVGRLQ
jgi:hypothetical protein